MRASGFTYQGIGDQLGASASQVYRWLNPEEAAEMQRRRRERVMAVIQEAKDVPCADCARRFPAICMDFDHNGSAKTVKLTDWARTVGASEGAIERLKAEIARCEVVCANCHRLRHCPKTRVSGQPDSSESVVKVAV